MCLRPGQGFAADSCIDIATGSHRYDAFHAVSTDGLNGRGLDLGSAALPAPCTAHDGLDHGGRHL